ncbi:MAG: tetratricopeptide repeat protein [Acidobacteriales bacterium]|nr:tetratricopeptide repeat protein [Terriglobales bacterium]
MNRNNRILVCFVLVASLTMAQMPAKSKRRSSGLKARPAQAESVTVMLQQADRLSGEGKLNAARDLYEKALAAGAPLDKDFDRAHTLGLVYLNGTPQDLKNAVRWLETAVNLRPADLAARHQLAQSLLWSGQAAEAVIHFKFLRQAKPDNQDYALALASAQYAKGDSADAVNTLRQYLERNPSNIEIRLQTARYLSYTQRFAEAQNEYQAILQIQPGNAFAEVGIAKVNSWQGNNDLAIEMYDRILRKRPNDFDAGVGKAFSLMWMGRNDEARDLFLAVQKRAPRDRDIAAALRDLGPKPQPKPAGSEVAGAKPTPAPTKPAQGVTMVPEPKVPVPEPAPPVVAETQPPAPAVPAPMDAYQAAMHDAEKAASGMDLTGAVHFYHEALNARPGDKDAMWQLARVLSWSKSYTASVSEYDKFIATHPDQLLAQVERARVLSWNKDYDTSLAGYEKSLQGIATCGPACATPGLNERDVRVEYARVLGWARRYDDAQKQYAQILPPTGPLAETDRTPGLDQGRVLAWSRKYEDSISAFDRVIQLGGENFDARLAKAQVLFWSGRLSEAQQMLRRLNAERPRDPEASLTLAAVEHALGYNSRSLALLAYATPGTETENIRKSIRDQMRPVLRFRYGFEDDQEIASLGASTGIKVLRYVTAVEFNIHPDVRMEVENTISNGLTSNPLLGKHAPRSLSSETIARFKFRIAPWLSMTAGAGIGITGGNVLGASGPRQQHAIFDLHPVITHDNLRIDLAVGRHIADYTPLAVHDNVMATRFSTAFSYNFFKRIRTGVEYWHALYNVDSPEPGLPREFTTEANGGSAYVVPAWYKSERLTIEAGMRYDSFSFDEGALNISAPAAGIPGSGVGPGITSAGFFTPRAYQRYAADIRITSNLPQEWYMNIHSTIGPQRLFGFAPLNPPPTQWGATGSAGIEVAKAIKTWRFALAYDYFSTETPASPGLNNGAYKSHAVSFSVVKRF